MRIFRDILFYIVISLASVVSIAFSFVELRTLLAGDFLLFNNAFVGGLGYFLRSAFYLTILALCVFLVIFRVRKLKVNIIILFASISILVGALHSLAFYDYYISLVVIFISLLLTAITFFGFFKKEENPSLE